MPIDRNSAQYITGATYKPKQTSAPGVWDLDDQANNIAKNLWPLPPQAVQRSLRFDGTSYFTRTFVAASRTTWTWSAWIKVCAFDTYRGLFVRGDSYIYFNANNKIEINLRNAATNYFLLATPVYRDPTAWYHIVVALDTNNGTAADRLKLYINNVRVQQYDISTYQNISTGYEPLINSAAIHGFGAADNAGSPFPGYMAEVNFISGQALDATSFGETDAQTGVWVPKRYTGTYGTNGFRLPFTNNSSTTALGYDASGNGNNWTPNNFSVTAGSGNDSLLDVPSLYGTDTGLGGEVRGNYCTLNPLAFSNAPYWSSPSTPALTNGNLDAQTTVAGYRNAVGTIALPTTGKWYFEALIVSSTGSGNNQAAGIISINDPSKIYVLDFFATSASSSRKIENGTASGSYAAVGAGTVVGVAVDSDNAKAYLAINNSWIDSGSPTTVANGYSMSAGQVYTPIFSGYNSGVTSFNFGQRPFAYTAPTGFKALCTTNLSAPAIGQTSTNQADNHFAVVTYQGNGSTQNIVTDFAPDFVWIKNRTTNYSHMLYDTLRGPSTGSVSKVLSSNTTDAEGTVNDNSTYGYLSAFNQNGFTVTAGSFTGSGGYTNTSGQNFVAWCWNAGGNTVTNNAGTITSQVRANTRAGFSVVTYTGTGANATVGHGLSDALRMIIVRNRDTVFNWRVWHTALSGTQLLYLNTTDSTVTDAAMWNSTTPTSSVFSVGTNGGVNENTKKIVAYCFAAIPGFSAFGSYTGNGSADGPFVHLGFRPRFVMLKRASTTGDWFMMDTARSPNNVQDKVLYANFSNAEASYSFIDMNSNGFKLRTTDAGVNGSGNTIIYMAFAETPARLSTAR